MPLPAGLLTTTCDIHRPFGAGTPTTSSVPCRLVACLARGRASDAGELRWSHYIDVQEGVDIRDGCGRAPGANAIVYGDGDEVRVPSGLLGATRYVVVWVERINRGTNVAFKRVYLLRDTVVWPEP